MLLNPHKRIDRNDLTGDGDRGGEEEERGEGTGEGGGCTGLWGPD